MYSLPDIKNIHYALLKKLNIWKRISLFNFYPFDFNRKNRFKFLNRSEFDNF